MKMVKHTPTVPSLFEPSLFDDNLFQGFFSPIMRSNLLNKANNLPVVDIDETDDNYMLLAEVPGFKKEEINVSLEDGKLVIKAEHEEKSEKKQNGGNILKERHYGSYYRSFNFGNNINEQKISAKYEDGVLELVIPKMTQAKQDTKKITIK
jgi:HSP20 family protein